MEAVRGKEGGEEEEEEEEEEAPLGLRRRPTRARGDVQIMMKTSYDWGARRAFYFFRDRRCEVSLGRTRPNRLRFVSVWFRF